MKTEEDSSGVCFPAFGEYHEDREPFEQYLERLKCHFVLYNVPASKQVVFFISCVGPLTYSKLRALVVPRTPLDLTFGEIEDVLRQYMNPKPLPTTVRQEFRRRFQKNGESFSEFLATLKRLALQCDFGGAERVNDELRDQVITGIRNQGTQNYFLRTPGLTLNDVVVKAQSDELASNGVAQLSAGQTEGVASCSKLTVRDKYSRNVQKWPKFSKRPQNYSSGSSEIICYCCAGHGHKASECKFSRSKCFQCGKIGHIRKACGKFRSRTRPNETPGRQRTDGRVHQVPEYVQIQTMGVQNCKDKIMVTLTLDSRECHMELDTGATYSLMSLSTYQSLQLTRDIQPCKVILVTYDRAEIPVAGKVVLDVGCKGQNFEGDLYLVDGPFDSVLGRDWLFKLETPWGKLGNNGNVHKIEPQYRAEADVLVKEYSDIFKPEIGVLKGFTASLHIEDGVKPIFCKPRSVPHALQERVNAEIDRLEGLGILTKTTYSDWATPVVPIVKGDGTIRLCGDYKVTLNRCLLPDDYPIPNIEEILARGGSCSYFSKFDVRQAYLHIQVDEEASKLLTINTQKGLYRVTRLMYGISVAPAIFQRCMDSLFRPCKGVQSFYDDVKLGSLDGEAHLQQLRQFFEICRLNGIRLNGEKCQVFVSEVDYLGYVLDSAGLHKRADKVRAIRDAKRPENVSELRSFIGLINYYSRFLSGAASLLQPLYRLLHKDTPFVWGKECEKAFNDVKKQLQSDQVLVPFDPEKPIILATDSSSYGLGACLSHLCSDGVERPIAFVSRTLNAAEVKYSQIDKEALAIYWGVKKFFYYLYGRKFTLLTDHKPLVAIFSPQAAAPVLSAIRLLHYANFLSGFTYEIRYRSNQNHGNADFCSRFPCVKADDTVDEPHVVQVAQLAVLPVACSEVAKSTSKDPYTLELLRELRRPNSKLNTKGEYTCEQGCVLKGLRVVIPADLRARVLQELHYGHLGVVKMKGLARSYVYWPGIDKDIEHLVRGCEACSLGSHNPPRVTSHPWEFPSKPWERVHIDFAGRCFGRYFLILVDAHSKWLEVVEMERITSAKTIECLREIFARFGLPYTLVSDNGPSLVSDEFESFLRNNGIKHIVVPPYHPSSNGQAERAVQTVKESLAKLHREGNSVHHSLMDFLLAYRKAPHSTTGESPATLMFGRNIRSRIDVLVPDVSKIVSDKQRKLVGDAPRYRQFDVGDSVSVRMYNRKDKWAPGVVISRSGSLIYKVRCQGRVFARHVNQLRYWSVADEPKGELWGGCTDVGTPENPDSDSDLTIHNEDTILEPEVNDCVLAQSRPSNGATGTINLDLGINSGGSERIDTSAAMNENLPVSPAARRGQRVRKPPDRFKPM